MSVFEITESVNTRTFLHNFTKFKRKKVLISSRNKKKEGVFIPYKEWLGLEKKEKQKPRKIKIEELRKFAIKTGKPSRLSEQIDDIYSL